MRGTVLQLHDNLAVNYPSGNDVLLTTLGPVTQRLIVDVDLGHSSCQNLKLSATGIIVQCRMGAGPTSLPESISLWRAAEPLCSAAWSSSGAASAEVTGAVSGDRAFTLEETRASMLAWVDELFEESIERLYDGAGWLPQAFLTYFAGPPDGKHAKMVEMLVVLVHEFSQVPIVVMHFGMCAPADWTPKRFPRMVLIHMGPLPGDSGRSFNFNKIRAMITARIRVGVQLDADQFVAPGVDALFQLTEKECTRAYPMPLMPSHFAERGPGMVEERLLSRAGGKYWERYCPGDPTNLSRFCTYQTTRWGHAHPTWTFWALPFLGRWLRMNFRDETLPRRVRDEDMGELGVMSALRIVIVPEDEDLLNIGLWEEGGTKQCVLRSALLFTLSTAGLLCTACG